MQTQHDDLSHGIGSKMPTLVHALELHQGHAPAHQVSPGQGLGLATKALAKPDDKLSTNARLTTTPLSVTLTSSPPWSCSTKEGVFLSPASGCRRCSTLSWGVEDLPESHQDPKTLAPQAYNSGSLLEPITR